MAILCLARTGLADDPPPLRAAPPPDDKPVVEEPRPPGDAPNLEKTIHGTTATASAGGMFTSGNSRLLAATIAGTFDTRFRGHGVGASLVSNYAETGAQGKPVQVTAESVQARLRYDRYVLERASVFLIGTGRHDRFQGLDLRFNLDPGFRYLFFKEAANALWAEAGYDFQYDVRRNDARGVLDANKAPVLDASGSPLLVSKTATDHSARLFLGFRRAFNREVTLAVGLEYLQSVVDVARSRTNADGLFAAKVGGGLAVGLGVGAHYDHVPLAGKERLDTMTTAMLIFAFSSVPEPPKANCP